ERRELVPGARGIAGRSREVPAESETALQPVGAELGLQVIEFQPDDVYAHSQFVFGKDLRNRAAEAVVELFAIERHPVGSRAYGVAVLECRQPAGSGIIAIVHAGNPQIQAVVRSKVRSGHYLIHAVIAEI